jgi:hypothetical protein
MKDDAARVVINPEEWDVNHTGPLQDAGFNYVIFYVHP